jgi:TonB-dependent receptor
VAAFNFVKRSSFALLALVLVTTLHPTAAHAQTKSTGTIKGKVLNASSGAYIKNATISVKGTNLQTYSDDYGDYKLENVPVGEVTVSADYIGEPQQSVDVTVSSGAAATKDFTFRAANETETKNGTVKLDPFTVNAERYHNANVVAIAEERHSVNIKNVVSTDAFGDIPSGNVGEFVKFLPGVQISYGNYANSTTGTSENTASGISVRGFGPEDTAILIDGMPVSNAAPGSLTRQVGLDMLSITNAERVELIKVATPDMPNNSMGGQVNLITRSAFEYPKPTYTARVYFNFNSLSTDLKATPGPVNKNTYKTTPGLDFSASYPVSKNFGFTVSGHAAREFDLNYDATPSWSYDKTASNFSAKIGGTTVYVHNAKGDMSIDNPMLTRFQVSDDPRMVTQTSGNVKLDWRPTPSQTLSANFQYSSYEGIEAERNLDIVPQYQPLTTSATLADFGPTYSISAVEASPTSTARGRAKADMTVTTIDKLGNTKSGQLQYHLAQDGWTISAAGSLSISNGRYVDHADGHYSGLTLSTNPGRVDFSDIEDGVPGKIDIYATNKNGGQAFDYTDLSKWTISNLIAQSAESYSRNTIGLYKLDVARDLSFLPFIHSNSLSIQVGARRDQEKTEKWGFGTGYRDVYSGTSLKASDILDTTYMGISPGYGQPAQQWASTYKLYELNQASPIFTAPTDGADAVNNWNSYVGQQKSLTETTDAFYAMLSGSFFHNRLSFVGGARKENKSRVGFGPFYNNKWNYATLPNGTLYHDTTAANDPGVPLDKNTLFLTDPALHARLLAAGVDLPDHQLGANSSDIVSAKRYRQANHRINDHQNGKPSESLSLAYKLTKKIDLKLAWSRSFGLPSLEDGANGVLSGNGAFTATENVTPAADGTLGVIKVANPSLPPKVSDNLDFQIAYYTSSGGKLGVSAYLKSVTNQPQNFSLYSDNPVFAPLMTALGLEPAAYQDWRVDTTTVSDSVQKTHGFEFEARQDFGFLGAWGNHWQAFATYTVKSLGQPSAVVPVTYTAPDGTSVTYTPTGKTINLTANHFAAAGLQFSANRFTAQIRGTYRNDNELSSNRVLVKGTTDNYLRRFEPAETRIDINASYHFSKNYSVFISGRDVFNSKRTIIIRDDYGLLPAYAQTYDKKLFGVTWTVGINGQW